jgi:hypothetical protein
MGVLTICHFPNDHVLRQKAISRQTKEEALQILESIRDTNLINASFDEKRNLIAKLGIKVYPSEDGKVLRISSTLQFAPSPLELSPQIISMASPILAFRHVISNIETFIELALVGIPDDIVPPTRAPKGNGANEPSHE